MTKQQCDLVLEGGGVKGIGLAGALSEVERAGYTVCRAAGASAGALASALTVGGMKAAQMRELLSRLDYRRFQDSTLLSRFGPPGKALSLLLSKSIYKGEYLRQWTAHELEKLGIRTFADLALTDDWCHQLPPEQRYKLVVIVADISRGRLVRLPWDYHEYGLDPNVQSVADAVRTSMALPFLYKPSRLNRHILVDGGILSNFPIGLFDTTPKWPTFGIKLSARPETNLITNPISSTYSYSLALIDTVLNAHDTLHLDDPCAVARTIFVDSTPVHTTKFDITEEEQARLYQSGVYAGSKFFAKWDFEKYKRLCAAQSKAAMSFSS